MFIRTMVAVCAFAMAGCGGSVDAHGSDDGVADGGSDSGLSQSVFRFPADGETGAVGPFCCTGKTITVRGRDGRVLGYAYFYDFGPAYNEGDDSYATSFAILVADADGHGDRVEFQAGDVHAGDVKSAQLGELVFVVEVQRVDVKSNSNGKVFNMRTLEVKLSLTTA